MSNTILLTGGSGDLGHILSRQLVASGFDCMRLDVRPPADEVGTYVEHSITERAGLADPFQGVDVVVHIAAWHGVHEARVLKSRDEFWDLNVTGAYNVFQASVDAGVDNIVYVSSTSVEDPNEFYGFTKRMGESIALEYAQRHGLNVIILRPRAFIPHWNREVYATFIEWAQWFWRGAVHIDDVSQAVQLSIDALLRNKLENVPTITIDGAYDYADEDLDNWDEAGQGSSFRKYYDEFVPLVEQHGLDISVKPSVKDIAEARCILGYEAKYGLRNLLEELREYGEAGPPKPGD